MVFLSLLLSPHARVCVCRELWERYSDGCILFVMDFITSTNRDIIWTQTQ